MRQHILTIGERHTQTSLFSVFYLFYTRDCVFLNVTMSHQWYTQIHPIFLLLISHSEKSLFLLMIAAGVFLLATERAIATDARDTNAAVINIKL